MQAVQNVDFPQVVSTYCEYYYSPKTQIQNGTFVNHLWTYFKLRFAKICTFCLIKGFQYIFIY